MASAWNKGDDPWVWSLGHVKSVRPLGPGRGVRHSPINPAVVFGGKVWRGHFSRVQALANQSLLISFHHSDCSSGNHYDYPSNEGLHEITLHLEPSIITRTHNETWAHGIHSWNGTGMCTTSSPAQTYAYTTRSTNGSSGFGYTSFFGQHDDSLAL